MLYLICEDEKAGYTFWKVVLDVFVKSRGKSVEYYTVKGNNNLLDKVDELLDSDVVHDKDTLLIAYDTASLTFTDVATGEVIDFAVDWINRIGGITDACRDKGINLLTTKYSCFEDLLLSFKLLDTCIENLNSDDLLMLQFVQAQIEVSMKTGVFIPWWGTEQYAELEKLMTDQFKHYCRGGFTGYEDFVAHLLSYVTTTPRTKKHLAVTKQKLGECWRKHCYSIGVPQWRNKMCIGCAWSDCATLLEKLVLFQDNSMFTYASDVLLTELHKYA